MKNLIIFPIICIFLFASCGKKKNNNVQNSFSDGIYNAEIEYYNPKTGTNSTYYLEVEIENDLLVKIYWNNGGWLDDSHFTPLDISSGEATFVSDRGCYYTVSILYETNSRIRERNYSDEYEEDDEIEYSLLYIQDEDYDYNEDEE